MGRGKIEIKRIENSTNRQVTYSKRRGGIFKKARELTVLCDAEVSLLMFSSTGKLSEYCSPSTTTKKVYDRYQEVTGINLWSSHYEKMQNHLNKLNDENSSLRREIRQRMGEDLDGLEMEELRGLEQNMDNALKVVRERKYHVIHTQCDTYRKKDAFSSTVVPHPGFMGADKELRGHKQKVLESTGRERREWGISVC